MQYESDEQRRKLWPYYIGGAILPYLVLGAPILYSILLRSDDIPDPASKVLTSPFVALGNVAMLVCWSYYCHRRLKRDSPWLAVASGFTWSFRIMFVVCCVFPLLLILLSTL